MPRILIISQVYVPDPAAVGQYMADGAKELAAQGYDVRVLTSARGYSDPAVKYPAHEMLDGVEVVRLPLSSLGKKTIAHRLVGQLAFLTQVMWRGVFTRDLAAILVSTSPPMAAIAAIFIRLFRRVPLKFWAMDLNPDQVIATGRFKPRSLPVLAFNWLNRRLLKAAHRVIALDRFMAERLEAKYPLGDKLVVIPPWPHEAPAETIEHHQNPFVLEHNLQDKFIVMYSGNHGMLLPLDTLLQASLRVNDDPRIIFLFIGDGVRKKEVEDFIAKHKPTNVLSLPYQPLDQIKYSLSAAHLHTVTMTDNMVGVIHPCKIYGIMGVGRPALFVGPNPSHVTDLLQKYDCGWQIGHGEVDQAEQIIRQAAQMPPAELQALGQNAIQSLSEGLSSRLLKQQFTTAITAGLPQPS